MQAERDHAELIRNHYTTRITELTSQVCFIICNILYVRMYVLTMCKHFKCMYN